MSSSGVRIVGTIVAIAYPFIVYFSLGHIPVRVVGFLLCAVFILRLRFIRARVPAAVKSVILAGSYSGALITGLSAILNEQQLLKYYPAIINSVLASIFLYTIFYPPTAIESLARIKNKNLPPEGVLYTRNVTWAWVIFFLCNGGVAAATAVYGSMSQWMLYNGLLSYFAIGLMLIGERLIRAWKLGE